MRAVCRPPTRLVTFVAMINVFRLRKKKKMGNPQMANVKEMKRQLTPKKLTLKKPTLKKPTLKKPTLKKPTLKKPTLKK
ncbi:unnamed protein product [Plasmodium vivax]|uniref:(malaria parasite P. vivax) hypothetical protein n=1 Tax=Plasmodium vivax TaxID=5855 RepID=A0A8S4HHB7_PLAVI|nr:unnamed protein product [Plasmodium vivax]